MIDRHIRARDDHRAGDDSGDARQNWSAPRLRSIIPVRRTGGGSGEKNGDVDDVIYDLS